MKRLFLFCRSGFEPECVQEIRDQFQAQAPELKLETETGAGFITVAYADRDKLGELNFSQLIFARQWFEIYAHIADLDTRDRISAMIKALADPPCRFGDVFIETPDAEPTKKLLPLCRSIHKALLNALQRDGKLQSRSPWRLHVCFIATDAVYLGMSHVDNSAAWPGGIPRLKYPRDAPSRSTLKLEEALLSLIEPRQLGSIFIPGRRAVDLGAAPGGWSYQLVKRGLRVVAVDNAKMDPVLLATEMVEHQRYDGFAYTPCRSVDWMVCDMVAQPIRIADLVAKWIGNQWCRHSIFNLKLPMKQRYREVRHCLDHISAQLQKKQIDFQMRAKQLYHDRDEITVYVCRDP